MDAYDPQIGPDKEAWMALDEQERVALIVRYHETHDDHPPAPNPQLHAVFHNIIETQACEDARIAAVLSRLVDEGLTRHNAVHAAGAVVQRYIREALDAERAVDEEAYVAELEELNGQDWLDAEGS